MALVSLGLFTRSSYCTLCFILRQQPLIHLAHNLTFHKCTKHIEIDCDVISKLGLSILHSPTFERISQLITLIITEIKFNFKCIL